jgi:hypothetical protein
MAVGRLMLKGRRAVNVGCSESWWFGVGTRLIIWGAGADGYSVIFLLRPASATTSPYVTPSLIVKPPPQVQRGCGRVSSGDLNLEEG